MVAIGLLERGFAAPVLCKIRNIRWSFKGLEGILTSSPPLLWQSKSRNHIMMWLRHHYCSTNMFLRCHVLLLNIYFHSISWKMLFSFNENEIRCSIAWNWIRIPASFMHLWVKRNREFWYKTSLKKCALVCFILSLLHNNSNTSEKF